MTVGVSIRGLVKRYGDAVAVDEISLDVAPGEFVTLLGPSGCGKTTTLRSIAGLEQPNAGTITIGDQTVFGDGHDVPVHRRRLGMVFQSYAVWPHMTVAENVRFPLRMLKEPRSKHRAIVAETLERVGLADFAKRYPGELSGGQQQRVALARALACNPAVILYDEPLSNLDAALREQMRFELRSLHRRLGTTAIYVTHDQQEALVLSDRICLMNRGKVVQVGAPSEVYESPRDSFASDFLGAANLWPVISADSADSANRSVQVGDGQKLQVSADQDAASAGSGSASGSAGSVSGASRVTIRPHQVRLHAGPGARAATRDGANCFTGVVRDATYLGDRIRYLVGVTDTFSVIAEENPAQAGRHDVGGEVTVSLPSEHCRLLI